MQRVLEKVLVVGWCLVAFVDFVSDHVADREVWKWCRIWRARNVATNGFVLRLVEGNVERRAFFDKSKELWRYVVVHANATVSARSIFHPSCVETIARFELRPIWHWRANKFRARGFISEVATRIATSTKIKVTMSRRTAIFLLTVDAEIAFWSRSGSLAYGNRHYEERLVALENVDHLRVRRDLNSDVIGVRRLSGWAIVLIVSSEAG